MIIYRCILPNGKMYIGQTHRELQERKYEHIRKSKIKTDIKYHYPFYRAIRKYGEKNLLWDIIDYANSQTELNEKEKFWIAHYNTYIGNKESNGYNQTIGGEGQNGLIHTEETKKRISKSETGENNSNAKLTKEQVLKIVELSRQNKYSQVELSRIFKTSEGTISRILSGLRWSSVTGIKYQKGNSVLSCGRY